jgi:hypothetical protein
VKAYEHCCDCDPAACSYLFMTGVMNTEQNICHRDFAKGSFVSSNQLNTHLKRMRFLLRAQVTQLTW